MPKLTIFLCAVLFASAVNASFVSDAVVSAEDKVDGLLTATIAATKQKFDDIKNKALELVAKLEAAAKAQTDKVLEQINSTLDKVQQEVDKLTGNTQGADVTECNKLAYHLHYTALGVIANMSSCVSKKIEKGSEYANSIIVLAENVLGHLLIIKEEARHCGDNVDGIKAAAEAFICTNKAAFEATWAATMSVPALTIEMTKITYLLATLQPSLAYCTTTNGFITFYHESSTIIEQTKKCIHQKLHFAHPDSVELEFTTEKVLSPEPTTNTEVASTPENVTDEIAEEA